MAAPIDPSHDDDTDEDTRLSQILRAICAAPEPLEIGQVAERLGRRSFGVMLFLFSTPNLLPLPPGSSTVLGAPLVLLSPQVAVGRRAPWLPRAVARRKLTPGALAVLNDRLIPLVERIERVSKPRLGFMFGSVGDRLIGLVCTVLSLLLILPVPFGNFLPAAAVGALAFSLVQRDGLLTLMGYALTAASASVLALAASVVWRFFERALALSGAA